MTIVIHHNEACGTSRNTLKIIEESGEKLEVINYLDVGWSKPQLLALFAAANLTPREALRETKSPAEELGLLEDGVSAATILEAMIEHPVLVNRPIVCSPKGVRLCRPAERVFDLMENPPKAFTKENGEVIKPT